MLILASHFFVHLFITFPLGLLQASFMMGFNLQALISMCLNEFEG